MLPPQTGNSSGFSMRSYPQYCRFTHRPKLPLTRDFYNLVQNSSPVHLGHSISCCSFVYSSDEYLRQATEVPLASQGIDKHCPLSCLVPVTWFILPNLHVTIDIYQNVSSLEQNNYTVPSPELGCYVIDDELELAKLLQIVLVYLFPLSSGDRTLANRRSPLAIQKCRLDSMASR